ncbi:MAG: phosphoadenosine phosphosulfate reductase family protein [Anaerolineae bacterium]
MEDILEAKIEKSKKILEEAIQRWKPHIGMAFSFGKDSTTIAHLIRDIYGEVPIPVLFTDTGVKFKETYEFKDRLVREWGLKVVVAQPLELYPGTMADDRERCCYHHKIEPAQRVMEEQGWKACIVGIRHDEHVARSREHYISRRENDVYRVHPILHWSEEDIWQYIHSRNVPYNPLYDKGYRSIGCEPCTVPTPHGAEERGGRDQDKEVIMERLRGWGYW